MVDGLPYGFMGAEHEHLHVRVPLPDEPQGHGRVASTSVGVHLWSSDGPCRVLTVFESFGKCRPLLLALT